MDEIPFTILPSLLLNPGSHPTCLSTPTSTMPPPPLLLPHHRRRPPRHSHPFLLLDAPPPHRRRRAVAPARPHPSRRLPPRAPYPLLLPPTESPCLPPYSAAVLRNSPIPSSSSTRRFPIVTAAPSPLLARIHHAASVPGRPTPFLLPHRISLPASTFGNAGSPRSTATKQLSHGRCRPLAAVHLLGTNSAVEESTEGCGTSNSRSPRRHRRFAKTAAGEASRSSIPSGSAGRPCRTLFTSPAKAAKQQWMGSTITGHGLDFGEARKRADEMGHGGSGHNKGNENVTIARD